MIEIKYACSEDKEWWYSLDRHLPEDQFDRKVRDSQGYVLRENGEPKALLRYNMFWDNTPFCTMLFVEWKSQRRGYGRKLMQHWEEDMRNKGYGMTMTSTRVDETSQLFYREIGYINCGGFTIDIPGFEQPMEIVMSKPL